MRAWLLLLVVLLPGCARPPAASADVPPAAHVLLSVVGPPRLLVDANGTSLAWTLEARANATGGAVGIDFSVRYQNRRDAGADHADAVVPDAGATLATVRTPYIGYGDYYYAILAHDARGRQVGEAHGMWERCPC
jgi:hypothetical protein